MNTIDRAGYLYGVRGIAILGVVAVHTSQTVSNIPEPWLTWANNGARGVELFFFASAITLLMSWHRRHDGALNFYVRRVFRIAPLFWLAVIGYTTLHIMAGRFGAPNGIGASDLVATVFFLHGWHPNSITSVVPGGWSIADEMMFYLLFPVLALFVRSIPWALGFVVLAVRMAIILDPAMHQFWSARLPHHEWLVDQYVYLWIGHVLPVFAAGFVTYFLIANHPWRGPGWIAQAMLIGSIASFFCLAAVHLNPDILPVFFVPLIYCLAAGAGSVLVSAPVRFIGKVSFGIYLWHFWVIDMINPAIPSGSLQFAAIFFGTLVISTFLATLSHYAVEQPLIDFGNLWLTRRSSVARIDPTVLLRDGAAERIDVGPEAHASGGIGSHRAFP